MYERLIIYIIDQAWIKHLSMINDNLAIHDVNCNNKLMHIDHQHQLEKNVSIERRSLVLVNLLTMLLRAIIYLSTNH